VRLLLLALASCSAGSDITGPFSGPVRSYAIDRFSIARDTSEKDMFADDLDGNGTTENKLGSATGVLHDTMDLTTDAPDMIASGALASVVTIQGELADGKAGVTYHGAEGESAVVAGGLFTDSVFISNRTRDTHAPGKARVHLPVFTNADPIAFDLEGVEIDLTPDGNGGYDGIVRGGVRTKAAREAAYAGLVQMFETEPSRHLVFIRTVDADRDDVITNAELDESILALLVAPDVALFDGDKFDAHLATMPDCVSVGFGVHLAACDPEAGCLGSPIVNACRDRIRDGDETDVDCGGSCQPCWTAKRCQLGTDCQSHACDGGACRPPTCSDGVRDGYESDGDCGGACAKCAAGRVCAAASDCASGSCNQGVTSLGTCN